MTILEAIQNRRSVRSFDGQELTPRDQTRLPEDPGLETPEGVDYIASYQI